MSVQLATVAGSEEKHVEYTIDLLNGRLVDGSIAPDDLIKLFKLCMSRKKKAIAHLCIVTGMFLCTNLSLNLQQTLDVALGGKHLTDHYRSYILGFFSFFSTDVLAAGLLYAQRALPHQHDQREAQHDR